MTLHSLNLHLPANITGNFFSHRYQVGDGVAILVTDINGGTIIGTVIAVNESGLPIAVSSGRKTYHRYLMTSFFYRT